MRNVDERGNRTISVLEMTKGGDGPERLDGRRPLTVLLVALLLTLLSGLPQLGISFMEFDLGGESLRRLPVTRSLLLDKILPLKTELAPPGEGPLPSSAAREADSQREVVRASEQRLQPSPSRWQSSFISRLYRHNSSYV